MSRSEGPHQPVAQSSGRCVDIEKIDDLATDHAVDQVTHRATQDQAQADTSRAMGLVAAHDEQRDQADSQHRQQRQQNGAPGVGQVREVTEQATPIARVGQIEETGDDLDQRGATQVGVGQDLGRLIQREHHARDDEVGPADRQGPSEAHAGFASPRISRTFWPQREQMLDQAASLPTSVV